MTHWPQSATISWDAWPPIPRSAASSSASAPTRRFEVRQHIVDFLCVATAGPCKYTGRDMKTAHTGLNITEADWNQMVKLLGETFDKFSVPEKERADVIGALAGLKGDIVGR